MSTETDAISRYAQGYSWALRWASQPEPPPVDKLQAYASELAPVYREILTAFQASGPTRTAGEPVAFGTVQNYLRNEGHVHSEAELEAAFDKLVAHGILTDGGAGVWYAPTKLGEALIGVVTGRPAAAVQVPDLPKPTW